jgi:hypothetical protein
MNLWTFSDVECWLIHTKQHSKESPSPVLSLDGAELVDLVKDENSAQLDELFQQDKICRKVLLKRRVQADMHKVPEYWVRVEAQRSLSYSYDSPQASGSPKYSQCGKQ